MNDPYVYKNSGVLKNLLHITDQKQLNMIETVFTFRRLIQFTENLETGKFDLDHFQKIHYHIFQDIYPFAGQLRVVNLSKNGDPFFPAARLKFAAEKLFKTTSTNRLC